jgi:phosphatidylglycerophosphatase C
VAHYRRRHRTKVRARLDWHLRQGHRVVIVSASPETYVSAAAAELAVHGVVATRLEVDADGKLTGRFEGANCRGGEKLLRLQQWIATDSDAPPVVDDKPEPHHVGHPYLWAYGNSAGDYEMLEAADIGVDAGRLGRFGKLRRFRRLGDVLTSW